MSYENNTSAQSNSYYSGSSMSGAYDAYKMGYWEEGEDPYKSDGEHDDESDGEYDMDHDKNHDKDRSYVGGFGWSLEFEADLEAQRQERIQMAQAEKKRRLYFTYRVSGMTTKEAAKASKLYSDSDSDNDVVIDANDGCTDAVQQHGAERVVVQHGAGRARHKRNISVRWADECGAALEI